MGGTKQERLTTMMIEVHNREAICRHFDNNPGVPITTYVPASGSWCETFESKEQYLRRQDAWDKALDTSGSGAERQSWWDLRGIVSYPWSPLTYR